MQISTPYPVTWKHVLLLALIVLLALFLRTWRLDDYSVYYDEYGALNGMELPSYAEATAVQVDNDQMVPLYFFLQYHWAHWMHFNVNRIRLLPITFGLLTLLLLFELVRRIQSPQAGLLAALLLALSPFNIIYNLELRPYALLGFLSLLSFFGIYLIITRKGPWGWLLALLANLLVMWTHLFGLWLLISEGLLLLLLQRHYFRRIALWTLAHIVLLIPLVLLVLSWDLSDNAEIACTYLDIPKTLFYPDALLHTPVVGQLYTTPYDIEPPFLTRMLIPFFYPLSILLSLSVAFLIVLFCGQLHRIHKAAEKPVLHTHLLLLSGYLLPPALLSLFSFLIIPAYEPRYVIISTIMQYAILAIAVTHIKRRIPRRIAIALLLTLFFLQSQIATGISFHPDDRAAAKTILRNATKDDIVLVYYNHLRMAFEFNLPEKTSPPILGTQGFFDCLQQMDHCLDENHPLWIHTTLLYYPPEFFLGKHPSTHNGAYPQYWPCFSLSRRPVLTFIQESIETYLQLQQIDFTAYRFPGNYWGIQLYHCLPPGNSPFNTVSDTVEELFKQNDTSPLTRILLHSHLAQKEERNHRWDDAAQQYQAALENVLLSYASPSLKDALAELMWEYDIGQEDNFTTFIVFLLRHYHSALQQTNLNEATYQKFLVHFTADPAISALLQEPVE